MLPKIRDFNENDINSIINFDKDFSNVLEEYFNKGWIKVATINDVPIGYFVLRKGEESAYFDNNISNWAEISELHVHPQYQRQGIGTLLTLNALKLAKHKGFSHVYVCTDDFNQAAQKMYLQCGFRELNRIIRYKFLIDDWRSI